jgi:hypothetical protein
MPRRHHILRDYVRRIRQPKLPVYLKLQFRAMELTEFSAIQAAKQV